MVWALERSVIEFRPQWPHFDGDEMPEFLNLGASYIKTPVQNFRSPPMYTASLVIIWWFRNVHTLFKLQWVRHRRCAKLYSHKWILRKKKQGYHLQRNTCNVYLIIKFSSHIVKPRMKGRYSTNQEQQAMFTKWNTRFMHTRIKHTAVSVSVAYTKLVPVQIMHAEYRLETYAVNGWSVCRMPLVMFDFHCWKGLHFGSLRKRYSFQSFCND